MLITEPNFQRKAHRVDIPLFVEIDEQIYRASDWSVGGLAIDADNLDYASGDIATARIVLPLGDAKLTLDVQLIARRVGSEGIGFEFKELSPKNRRILRHYIQLYIDGKLENAEDLIAISTGPEVGTPLNDALNLTEENTEMLVSGFKRRGLVAAVLILFFLVTFISVLFYNTNYRLETTGIVIGNIDRVTANYGGVLLQVDAKLDTYVTAGTPLFRLRNTGASGQSVRSSGSSLEAEKELLKGLEREKLTREKAYRNALELFEQHLITRKDLEGVKNAMTSSRTAYLRQKAEIEGGNTHSLLVGGGTGDPLYPIIRAKHDGQVVAISGTKGSYVGASDVVVILQRNDKVPQAIIAVENKDVLKLNVGMKAEIYVPFQDISYSAGGNRDNGG